LKYRTVHEIFIIKHSLRLSAALSSLTACLLKKHRARMTFCSSGRIRTHKISYTLTSFFFLSWTNTPWHRARTAWGLNWYWAYSLNNQVPAAINLHWWRMLLAFMSSWAINHKRCGAPVPGPGRAGPVYKVVQFKP
jgi:hypothetical protein